MTQPVQPTPPARPRPAHLLRRHLQAGLGACLIAVGAAAWAHGGEDHGDHADAALSAPAPKPWAPQTATRTDSFELVATLDIGTAPAGPTLTIYLDTADTNTPVAGASIDVDSGSFRAHATAVSPGVYSVPASDLTRPGHYPLTFTVQTDQDADLLEATLDTTGLAAPDPAAAQGMRPALRYGLIALGALALGALLAFVFGKRARAQATSDQDPQE